MNQPIDALITNRLINDRIRFCRKGKSSRLYFFSDDDAGKSVKAIEMTDGDEKRYFDALLSRGFYTTEQKSNIVANLTTLVQNCE